MSDDKSHPMAGPAVGAGVFLTTLAVLLLELAITRVFSVTLYYHFAFMAVSLALFGLGGGSLLLQLRPALFPPEGARRLLSRLSLMMALSIPITSAIILRLPVLPDLPVSQSFWRLAMLYLLTSVPFFLAGIQLALVFSLGASRAGRLYSLDLLGSGAGCLLAVPAMGLLGGPGTLLLAGAVAGTASVCFRLASPPRRLILASLVTVALALAAWTNTSQGWLRITISKGHDVEEAEWIKDQWNAFSRVTVHRRDGETFAWGLSPTIPPPQTPQLWLSIDDAAGTPITEFNGSTEPLEFLKKDITTLAHHMRPGGRTAIIGGGGGIDILSALTFGSKDITAVEINPLVVDIVGRQLGELSGHLYFRPEVHTNIDDGRTFMRRSGQTFDIIQISLIDTWAATAAGALGLTENNLYTVEAVQDFVARLDQEGLLSITRFLFEPPRQSLRVVSLYIEAARRMGITDAGRHIFVARSGLVATSLFKRSPFTGQELLALHRHCKEMEFGVVYSALQEPQAPRLFDVYLQGEPLALEVDVAESAGGTFRPAQLRGEAVTAPGEVLVLAFRGREAGALLSGVEVISKGPEGEVAQVVRLNAGGTTWADAEGHVWVRDRDFGPRESYGFEGGTKGEVDLPIAGTQKDMLYRSSRLGEFRFLCRVPPGRQEVRLLFAETFASDASRVFHRLVASQDPWHFPYPFDVRPTTDDRPFFFQLIKVKDIFAVDDLPSGQRFNYVAVTSMVGLLFLVLVLALAFVVLPPALGAARARGLAVTAAGLGSFACLGLGFMLVEMPLIQSFVLFLGHPLSSLAVTLLAILTFSGLGSFLSQRWALEGLRGRVWAACALVGGLTLFYAFALPPLFDLLAGLPLWARAMVSVGLLAPLGLAMGVPLPSGLRLAGEAWPQGIPWLWAVNCATSVLGSVLAVVVALILGFKATLALGVGAYGLAALCLGLLAKGRSKT